MASFPLNNVTVSTNEVVSAAVNAPNGLASVTIQMTACPQWDTTTGGFFWGVEGSLDGGTTWLLLAGQGYGGSGPLAIGSRDRFGGLPALRVSMEGQNAAKLRARTKTDGPTLTCSFTITAV